MIIKRLVDFVLCVEPKVPQSELDTLAVLGTPTGRGAITNITLRLADTAGQGFHEGGQLRACLKFAQPSHWSSFPKNFVIELAEIRVATGAVMVEDLALFVQEAVQFVMSPSVSNVLTNVRASGKSGGTDKRPDLTVAYTGMLPTLAADLLMESKFFLGEIQKGAMDMVHLKGYKGLKDPERWVRRDALYEETKTTGLDALIAHFKPQGITVEMTRMPPGLLFWTGTDVGKAESVKSEKLRQLPYSILEAGTA